MRTYTRKRTTHQLIEDVHKLCRLCLKKAEESVPIYTSDKDNICASLALRIMICVGLEISRDDCLPNMVCTDCCKELERYYSFRKKCEVTYQKLKSHALAVKEKEEYNKITAKNIESCNNLNEIRREIIPIENIKEDGTAIVLDYNEDNKLGIINTDINDFVKNEESLSNNIEVEECPSPEVNAQPIENPDLGKFLSTILLELGILSKLDDKLTLADQSVRSLELETGDGRFVVELMQEEEEIKHVTHTETLEEDKIDLVRQCDIEDNDKKDGDGDEAAGRTCGACGKRFATRSVLARHARVHSGERPHACRVCERRFAQRAVMLRHELVHREQRPHQCPHCPKSFTQRGALGAHVRSHAPPQQRPLSLHRCPRCPKLFLHASGLSRHLRAHSGRVFACSACARPFRDESSLLRHVRTARHPAA